MNKVIDFRIRLVFGISATLADIPLANILIKFINKEIL